MPEVDKPFIVEAPSSVKVGENKDIEVVLPRLTLKKIIAVTDAVDKLVKSASTKSPQLFELFSKSKTDESVSIGTELAKLVPSILPVILKELIDVLSIYLNKPKEFIEDNMDMEDLVAVATPFFADILKQGNYILGPLTNLFPKEKTEV